MMMTMTLWGRGGTDGVEMLICHHQRHRKDVDADAYVTADACNNNDDGHAARCDTRNANDTPPMLQC